VVDTDTDPSEELYML